MTKLLKKNKKDNERKSLLEMKKYFEDMKDTCESMLGYINKKLKKKN
jgi:hypothetical protein